MAITYAWSFPNFETNSNDEVKTIHWRYTATETVGDNDYSASMYGSCDADDIDFTSMTKQNAIDKVLAKQDTTEADMQTNLSAQITSQKTPETTSQTKDW